MQWGSEDRAACFYMLRRRPRNAAFFFLPHWLCLDLISVATTIIVYRFISIEQLLHLPIGLRSDSVCGNLHGNQKQGPPCFGRVQLWGPWRSLLVSRWEGFSSSRFVIQMPCKCCEQRAAPSSCSCTMGFMCLHSIHVANGHQVQLSLYPPERSRWYCNSITEYEEGLRRPSMFTIQVYTFTFQTSPAMSATNGRLLSDINTHKHCFEKCKVHRLAFSESWNIVSRI